MTFFRKKYYKEVMCKACDGTGKQVPMDLEELWQKAAKVYPQNSSVNLSNHLLQGVCAGCNGKGTQTVLDRIE